VMEMSRVARLPIIMLAILSVALLVACPKRIETNEPGPGGLPRGIVSNDSNVTADQEDWPIYEGAHRRLKGVYETSDPIGDVKAWYSELLGVQPVILDPSGQALTYETDEYILVLMPMMGQTGTEIRFTSKEETGE
jgi:hypothetical protein